MAKIIENLCGRRNIRLNTDDIINIVREYQNICSECKDYEETRKKLNNADFFIPEDLF